MRRYTHKQVEYAALRYAHPAVETVTKTQYWERRLGKKKKKDNLCDRDPDEDCFDIILSISSFEHDGLGRYGDPLGLSELKAAYTSSVRPPTLGA